MYLESLKVFGRNTLEILPVGTLGSGRYHCGWMQFGRQLVQAQVHNFVQTLRLAKDELESGSFSAPQSLDIHSMV